MRTTQELAADSRRLRERVRGLLRAVPATATPSHPIRGLRASMPWNDRTTEPHSVTGYLVKRTAASRHHSPGICHPTVHAATTGIKTPLDSEAKSPRSTRQTSGEPVWAVHRPTAWHIGTQTGLWPPPSPRPLSAMDCPRASVTGASIRVRVVVPALRLTVHIGKRHFLEVAEPLPDIDDFDLSAAGDT